MSDRLTRSQVDVVVRLAAQVKKMEGNTDGGSVIPSGGGGSPGVLVQEAAYIIRINGSKVEAINGETGQVEFSYG